MPESMTLSGKHKHLTLADRSILEAKLAEGKSFTEIGRIMQKDPSTLAKEVKLNRRKTEARGFNTDRNHCHHRRNCQRKHLCSYSSCLWRCAECRRVSCNGICPDFKLEQCPQTHRAPYVCNACVKRSNCRLEKYYYKAPSAHSRYRTRLSESRTGINLAPDELEELDALVTPLLKRGQPIAHIFASHAWDIPCSRKTLYHYIHCHYLGADNFDLPRKVKYKPRRKHCKETAPNPRYRRGRSYKDFLAFLGEHPDTPVVEMDTVEGSLSPEVLLTLFFRSCSLMLIYLLPSQTQSAVQQVFDALERALGFDLFLQLFPLILTDNGSEFKNPHHLASSLESYLPRTSIFYCDPGASWQKAQIEKNHEFIRYVLPKGVSFEELNQNLVDRLRDHVNNTCRDTLNKNSPAAVAEILLPSKALSTLGLKRIPPDEVCLKASLLKF